MNERLIQRTREAIVRTCLQLADLGYLAGIGGNLAARIDTNLFAVTPSAADYYALEPEDICVLRLDSLEQIAGEMSPSVESGMHAALLRRRPDLNASVHTHQPIASAVTLLDRRILVQDAVAHEALGPAIEITSYAPSGTSWLMKNFAKILRDDCNGYLLRNHGVTCGGRDLEQAVRNVQFMESEAARFLRDRLNEKTAALPPHLLHQVNEALAI